MKPLIVVAAIVFSAFSNQSYASGKSDLIDKIESLTLEPGSLESSNTSDADFVKVQLKVNEQGKLEILEINYSNKKLKDLLIKKLEEIELNEDYGRDEILNYKFSFELV